MFYTLLYITKRIRYHLMLNIVQIVLLAIGAQTIDVLSLINGQLILVTSLGSKKSGLIS